MMDGEIAEIVVDEELTFRLCKLIRMAHAAEIEMMMSLSEHQIECGCHVEPCAVALQIYSPAWNLASFFHESLLWLLKGERPSMWGRELDRQLEPGSPLPDHFCF